MHHQRHFDRVRGLVSGYSGVPEAEIGMESRLVEDLGLDCDTGHELLESFAEEFGVDMSRMAPFNYFDDEPPLFWFSEVIPVGAALVPAFRRYVRHATRGRRAVTIRDLIASAHAGRWIRPAHHRTDLDPVCLTWRSLLAMALVTPLVAFLVAGAIGLLAGGYGDGAAGPLVLVAVIAGLLAGKGLMARHWLRRLDAAARFEEQALSAGC